MSDGRPVLDDGRSLDIANVVWCTGFHPDYSWIDLPVFDEAGMPVHQRGAVIGEPGLYFVGLHFLYALSSTMIHGVGRDARYVADTIGERLAQRGQASCVRALPAYRSSLRNGFSSAAGATALRDTSAMATIVSTNGSTRKTW